MASDDTKHAQFDEKSKRCCTTADRGRILTMRYGKHQMKLIRKRICVENWIEDRLAELYSGETDVAIELDKVLDIASPSDRRQHILDILQKSQCPASKENVQRFIDELITKLDLL
ncbi:hypothetical protein AB6A40_004174 [Gnathostoma spinigerum]|uniref:Protein phosphatase 1 regulatory subunit 14B n=1 Tax=Gnathostoma spinigerum TaxID=75299 RepID=A0ABD6EBP9_9BILA